MFVSCAFFYDNFQDCDSNLLVKPARLGKKRFVDEPPNLFPICMTNHGGDAESNLPHGLDSGLVPPNRNSQSAGVSKSDLNELPVPRCT